MGKKYNKKWKKFAKVLLHLAFYANISRLLFVGAFWKGAQTQKGHFFGVPFNFRRSTSFLGGLDPLKRGKGRLWHAPMAKKGRIFGRGLVKVFFRGKHIFFRAKKYSSIFFALSVLVNYKCEKNLWQFIMWAVSQKCEFIVFPPFPHLFWLSFLSPGVLGLEARVGSLPPPPSILWGQISDGGRKRRGKNICKRKEGGRIGGGGTIQLQKVTMVVRDSPTKKRTIMDFFF